MGIITLHKNVPNPLNAAYLPKRNPIPKSWFDAEIPLLQPLLLCGGEGEQLIYGDVLFHGRSPHKYPAGLNRQYLLRQ